MEMTWASHDGATWLYDTTQAELYQYYYSNSKATWESYWKHDLYSNLTCWVLCIHADFVSIYLGTTDLVIPTQIFPGFINPFINPLKDFKGLLDCLIGGVVPKLRNVPLNMDVCFSFFWKKLPGIGRIQLEDLVWLWSHIHQRIQVFCTIWKVDGDRHSQVRWLFFVRGYAFYQYSQWEWRSPSILSRWYT